MNLAGLDTCRQCRHICKVGSFFRLVAFSGFAFSGKCMSKHGLVAFSGFTFSGKCMSKQVGLSRLMAFTG